MKHKRYNGFTLAEVLITIGIIGIVAAITIPGLMTKIRHIDTSAKLKKFYSMMKQMVISAEDDYGPVNDWDIKLPYETFLQTYITPYIKNGGINQDKIMFADGTTMQLRLYNGNCLDLLFDVNGQSKPNKEGYDRFRFLICPENVTSWCGDVGFCTYRQNSYKNNREMLLKCCKSNCSGHAGLTCSRLLEYDNWRFEKDYPFK